MCLNGRWIFNKYTEQRIFVKCGHCEACKKERANKVMQKIQNTFSNDYQCFFVTLTYKNEHCPYVRRSELDCYPLNIYRDVSLTHYVRVNKHGQSRLKTRYFDNTQPIDTIDLVLNGENFSPLDIPHLQNYDSDKIGICYYKDVQDYLKRFRQILKRKYDFNERFLYFSCSEYGGKTSRNHFHILFFFPKGWYHQAKFASYAAWSYDSRSRKELSFQIARKPAEYVSGYLCKSPDLSDFFRIKAIRQKHSCSVGFGQSPYYLSLYSLLSKIDEGRLSINFLCSSGPHTGEVHSVLFPKYIADRYFPKFKGYHSLNDNEIYNLLTHPSTFWKNQPENPALILRYGKKRLGNGTISDNIILKRTLTEDFQNFYTRYTNIVLRYFDGDFDNYARYFIRYHNLRQSEILKRQYMDYDGDLSKLYQKFDNFRENYYYLRNSDNIPLYKWSNLMNLDLDPNHYPDNIQRNDELASKFKNMIHLRNQLSELHFV